jgi:hypothetical protein
MSSPSSRERITPVVVRCDHHATASNQIEGRVEESVGHARIRQAWANPAHEEMFLRPALNIRIGSGTEKIGKSGAFPPIPLAHGPSIRTSFIRPAAPLLMDTAAFGHRKRAATKATSSRLALPSTGADWSCARQMPPSNSSSALRRAFGVTLTEIVLAPLIRTAIPAA